MTRDPLAADRARALSLVPVSRETEARFALYAELLVRWQRVKNLVGPNTLTQVWTRHIADSAQLLPLAPQAKVWVDMGSGAGFPGLVLAILLRDRPGACVHLVEANARKCAFLREAARSCGAVAEIHQARIEDVAEGLGMVDVVTARALAPLPHLIEMGKILFDRGAAGLFLKSEGELAGIGTTADPGAMDILPSRTSAEGRILRLPAPVRLDRILPAAAEAVGDPTRQGRRA